MSTLPSRASLALLLLACGCPSDKPSDSDTQDTPDDTAVDTDTDGETDTPEIDTDPQELPDEDKDGYSVLNGDCNDRDAATHPGAAEIADEIDNNCNDMVDEGFRQPGDVVITEILFDSSGDEPDSEWFEVMNTTSVDIHADGIDVWTPAGGGDTFVIAPEQVVIPAQGVATFCWTGSDPTLPCDYAYGDGSNRYSSQGATSNADFSLSNTNSAIRLSLDGTTIDEAAYDTRSPWPRPVAGTAISLDPGLFDSLSNDDGTSWCLAVDIMDNGDIGSPGAINPSCTVCPKDDQDCDGTAVPDDCDDTDPTIRPGAIETWYDGVDQDCDGNDTDADFDGSPYTTDCDDASFYVHSGATDWPDGLDNDCDGDVDDLVGSLVISEIMADPSTAEPDGEWFEIYNGTSSTITLDGVLFQSSAAGREVFTIPVGAVTIPVDSYISICYVTDTIGRACYYNYGLDTHGTSPIGATWDANFTLANAGSTLEALFNGTILDSVTYSNTSPWPRVTGRSIEVSVLDPILNDDGANWCAASSVFGVDYGTPSAVNDCSIAR